MMDLISYDIEFTIAAILLTSFSFVFYSFAVWGERFQEGLRMWHLVALGFGLMCNLFGATFMSELTRLAGYDARIFVILGNITIFLMTIHGIWATWTYWKGSKKAKQFSNRYSIFLWGTWLTVYCTEVYIGMITQI